MMSGRYFQLLAVGGWIGVITAIVFSDINALTKICSLLVLIVMLAVIFLED